MNDPQAEARGPARGPQKAEKPWKQLSSADIRAEIADIVDYEEPVTPMTASEIKKTMSMIAELARREGLPIMDLVQGGSPKQPQNYQQNGPNQHRPDLLR